MEILKLIALVWNLSKLQNLVTFHHLILHNILCRVFLPNNTVFFFCPCLTEGNEEVGDVLLDMVKVLSDQNQELHKSNKTGSV